MQFTKIPRRSAIAVLAMAACLVPCHPAWANNGACMFRVVGTMTLAFGSIDPSSAANVVASITPATVAQIGDCKSVTMSITADNGQNFSGGRRMAKAGGTDFIPYSLTLPPNQAAPGNNRYVGLVITGTITPAAFQNAGAGDYSDSVIITVSP